MPLSLCLLKYYELTKQYPGMAKVSLKDLCIQYGQTTTISNLSLDVADGELVTLLGPSGCGKTTTLRAIAGFIKPVSGQILFDNKNVTTIPAHKRGTGMVFQRYALFPHLNVRENIAFGLKMHHYAKGQCEERIKKVLDMMSMPQYANRYPYQLSGGEQQRIAIARALAIEPQVFLLDEPLSNLDTKLRIQVCEEIKALQQRLGLSTIFVTHDQEEALSISDRVAVMHKGRVEQIGSPEEIYHAPRSLFVAEFLGGINFFRGHLKNTHQFQCDDGLFFAVSQSIKDSQFLGVRHEKISLHSELQPELNNLHVQLIHVVFKGAEFEVQMRTAHNQTLRAQIPSLQLNGSGTTLTVGEHAYASFSAQDAILLIS